MRWQGQRLKGCSLFFSLSTELLFIFIFFSFDFGLFAVCVKRCCPTINGNFILLSCPNTAASQLLLFGFVFVCVTPFFFFFFSFFFYFLLPFLPVLRFFALELGRGERERGGDGGCGLGLAVAGGWSCGRENDGVASQLCCGAAAPWVRMAGRCVWCCCGWRKTLKYMMTSGCPVVLQLQ